jgi:DNA mismatch repair protein MutL
VPRSAGRGDILNNDKAIFSSILHLMKIHILPQEVADQIAAGEVVERPASVVKELMENAIDAGSTQIDVFIEDGGKRLIEVRDNGTGMAPDDAEKCILRHATSKIETIDDVFAIRSFGFRGEALAAISAISDFEIITKQKENIAGTRVQVNAGKLITVESAPANTGSIFRIKNLFAPVPARLAHLKNTSTEMSAIRREFESFALTYPHIGFQLFRDETVVLDFPIGEQADRVSNILAESSPHLIDIEGLFPSVKIRGWVVKPGLCSTSKKSQLLWVNGRNIDDHKLTWAIREAYHQTAGIEKHLFPKFAIWIDIEPILVDVNVHPRKTEVKFSEPGEIWNALKHTISSGLQRSERTLLSAKGSVARFTETQTAHQYSNISFRSPSFSSPQKRNTEHFSRELFSSSKSFNDLHHERSKANENPIGTLKLVGQVARKYILAEAENGLWIFDQHALHERQRFELFWKEREKLVKEKQTLLVPYAPKIDEEQRELLLKNRDQLNTLGFEFDKQLHVIGIPSLFTEKDIDTILSDLADWLENEQVGEHSSDKLLRKLIEYKACRGSVMFGDEMQREEMQKLLDDFETTQWRNLCPHGRPNHIFWAFEDLDKGFHR